MGRKAMFFNSSAAAYSTEYQAVLDYADLQGYTTPSNAQNDINNAIIENSKTESVWTEYDIFYYFAQESGIDDFTKINWRDPANFYLTEAQVNPHVFVANSGWLAEAGFNEVFDTSFVPSTDAVKCIKEDSGFIFGTFGMDTVFVQSAFVIGARTVNSERISINNNADGQFLCRTYGDDPNLLITQADINAHYHISDIVAVSNRYIDGVLNNSTTNVTVGGITQVSVALTGINNSGVFSGALRDVGLKYVALGSNLGSKQLEIYQILNGLY